MVGGMVLIGTLVVLLDLQTAMLLISAVLITTNLWRAITWHRQVSWSTVAGALAGVSIAFSVLMLSGFRPDKAIVLLVLSLPPLLINLIPARWWPSINSFHGRASCGLVFGSAVILGGSASSAVDMFFQKSELDRLASVATKAAMAVPVLVLRTVFFLVPAYGSLSNLAAEPFKASVPFWAFPAASVVGVLGVCLGGAALRRWMSDTWYREWNWRIAIVASLAFAIQGFLLLDLKM